MQSRLSREAFNFNVDGAKSPQIAETAKMLKIADPTMVPMLMSPSLINVPTQLMHNSGDDVAIVINMTDANSCFILSSEKERLINLHQKHFIIL